MMKWAILVSLLATSFAGNSCPSRATYRENKMNTSHQALEAAYQAIADRAYSQLPGDVVVEMNDSKFRVVLSLLSPDNPPQSWVVKVELDARTASVSDIKVDESVPLPEQMAGVTAAKFISAKRAYDVAFQALKGFDTYDKQGKLTVELRNGKYFVTFPLMHKTPGARSADFAMQIWIDASTGAVIKRSVAS